MVSPNTPSPSPYTPIKQFFISALNSSFDHHGGRGGGARGEKLSLGLKTSPINPNYPEEHFNGTCNLRCLSVEQEMGGWRVGC